MSLMYCILVQMAPHTFGGISEQSGKVFSVKILFSTNSPSFLPWKFLAVRYLTIDPGGRKYCGVIMSTMVLVNVQRTA